MACFLCILLISLSQSSFSATVNVIAIRHAEKALGEDPPLTEKGLQRAKALVQLQDLFDIRALYTSNTKRAAMTASPLAVALKLEINESMPKRNWKKWIPICCSLAPTATPRFWSSAMNQLTASSC